MSGFENVAEENVRDVNSSNTQTAAEAMEGLLDLGPEDNPEIGQQGAAEQPAQDEEVEQFGQAVDNPPGTELEQNAQQAADEHGVEIDVDTEQQQGELYTVTVQGETREVSLDDLQSGYMLQSDYTKKTQGLAEERRHFDGEVQQVQQERQQYVELLSSLEQQLSNGGEAEPDWVKLSQSNPVAYTQEKAAWDQRTQILDAAKTERERVQGLQTQEFQKRAQEHGAAQREALLRVRPELKDPEKANAYQTQLRNYAVETYGFTDMELGSIIDHRQALILEKAMRYDAAVKKGGKVQKQLKSNGPRAILRPGAVKGAERVKSSQHRQAQDRFARTGDVKDAARAMEDFL